MGDVSGAIRVISSSDSVLPPSLDLKNKLAEKHPPGRNKIYPPPNLDSDHIVCSIEEVKKAIKSFKPGSSGGQDGLLPVRLLDMTSEELGEPSLKLLEALRDLFNKLIFPGKVPKEMCATLFGANLIEK